MNVIQTQLVDRVQAALMGSESNVSVWEMDGDQSLCVVVNTFGTVTLGRISNICWMMGYQVDDVVIRSIEADEDCDSHTNIIVTLTRL